MSDPKVESKDQEKSIDDAAAEDNVADAADEEDLEKLQAEIAKMEEEAAKIAAETADLEKAKDANATSSGVDTGDAAAGNGAAGKEGAKAVDQ